ncbi:Subtilisin-like serine endopeptidase family protein [Raphanus sativus]|uniref:Subtilisin-like protease SBT3.18 n=1 Tax=Raphanus sativus TaxID=3726 RepID=A0A6J0N356_RAPSA|nr:subtilisin-like protease SBT3.18 [Raphanus sativus]KAJ4872978.1 Subtilisin-like serine endopeptidase family protein [Raphanus sativus]
MTKFLGGISFALTLLVLHSSVQATTPISHVYIVYLGANRLQNAALASSHHLHLLSQVFTSKEDAERSMLYSYTYGFSGFSAKLNSTQAASLAKMNQVITVFKSRSLKLHTTRSWDFLGLTVDNTGHTPPPPQLAYGSDVIVGIFDTGIWPESESFKEPPEAKPIPSSWKGECVGGGDVQCNRKLIGARFYLRGFEETYGELDRTRDREYRSPRDGLGHGTHTASTAVGSVVSDVSGFAGGTARGGAPSARLAVYKTCWGKDLEGVCTEADILAAFDDAVRDGVSVISASFGSSPPLTPFFESSADIGAFHAAERGISVVFSGGNDGPDPGLVQNVAPWAVSVAASTMDRSFPTSIIIDGGYTLTGQSLISQEIIGTLALATTYFDGGVCKWEYWLKKLANEMIILCFSTLGPIQFIEEAQAAAVRANASAVIFAASPTKQLVEEVDKIPTVRVDIISGTRIRNYLARSPTTVPMVKVGPSKTVIGEITAPSVAYFSSRGPSSLTPDILKPDITAPGIGILGAWPPKTPPTLLPGDHRSVEWNFQSGTSMSCPHVAGVMALLQSAHPDWSPAAIRSAIMTTAGTRDTSNELILSGGSMKPTDPFDIGAGHINPLKAMDPGLVYITRTEDYVLFLCNIGYTDQQIKSMLLLHSESSATCLPSHSYRTNADFNYPSITIPRLRSTRTIKRTVSNVGPNKSTVYFVDIVRPVGVEVDVWPRILVFTKCQQEHSYYVTFKPTKTSSGRYVFGEIVWTNGFHRVRSPLVVFLSNSGFVAK